MIINVVSSHELVTIVDILFACLFRDLIEMIKFMLDMCLELLLFFHELIESLNLLFVGLFLILELFRDHILLPLRNFMLLLDFLLLLFKLSEGGFFLLKFLVKLFFLLLGCIDLGFLLLDGFDFLLGQ